MSDKLRRWTNRVERWMDWRALRRPRAWKIDLGAGQIERVRPIWEVVRTTAMRCDRDARLRWISSPEGVCSLGRSRRWEFFLDLPGHRSQLQLNWQLQDAEATLEAQQIPFPAVGSIHQRLVEQGKSLYRELGTLWEQERQRSQELPVEFRDSDLATAQLVEQGLDVIEDDFTLSSGWHADGYPQWVARCGDREYRTHFASE